MRSIISRKLERGLQKPFVDFQFIVMKQNEHQMDDVRKYCMEIGIDKLS